MGRPYAAEIGEFAATYSRALETPLDGLADFVESASGTPLYAVGSGGSLTACVLASILHGHGGSVAKPVTPMEFLDSRGTPPSRRSAPAGTTGTYWPPSTGGGRGAGQPGRPVRRSGQPAD